jgi:hypothetical protein
MKRWGFFFILVVIVAGVMIYFNKNKKIETFITPLGQTKINPLEQYSYDNLKAKQFSGSQIIIDKELKTGEEFNSYLFYYSVNGKKISGMLNLPKKEGIYPVIVMARGYIDQKTFTTGEGTRHSGEVLATNGFITLAPDFLGFGQSDPAVKDPFEDRFLTYVSELELLASIKNLNYALEKKGIKNIQVDSAKVGLWGHSNGGQITLTALEVTGKKYPTVLWAPVSKPFPYSILYYTDDVDDHGKMLRKVLADFEKDYDVEKYSLTNYLSWINAPIQLHQGGADEAVPQKWSDLLVEELKKDNIKVDYYTYPGDDHNFTLGSWNMVIQRTIAFYNSQFSVKN